MKKSKRNHKHYIKGYNERNSEINSILYNSQDGDTVLIGNIIFRLVEIGKYDKDK